MQCCPYNFFVISSSSLCLLMASSATYFQSKLCCYLTGGLWVSQVVSNSNQHTRGDKRLLLNMLARAFTRVACAKSAFLPVLLRPQHGRTSIRFSFPCHLSLNDIVLVVLGYRGFSSIRPVGARLTQSTINPKLANVRWISRVAFVRLCCFGVHRAF